MKKIVAFDIDGTILNKGKISEKVEKTIKFLTENDIFLVPVTGRNLSSIKEILIKLNLHNNMNIGIFNTGSEIQEISTGKIIKHINLTLDDYYEIKKYINSNLGIYIYTPFDSYYEDTCNEQFIKDTNILSMPRYKLDKSNKDIKISRINVMSTKEELDKIYDELFNKFSEKYYIVRNIDESIEFLNKDASKGKTLKYLADKFNISKCNIISIGDGNNDITMKNFSDKFIAMGNSSEYVKKYADIVAKSIDEDGFLEILKYL